MQVSGDVAHRRQCMSQGNLHTLDNAGLRRYCAKVSVQVSGDIAHRRQCRSQAMLHTGDNAGLRRCGAQGTM